MAATLGRAHESVRAQTGNWQHVIIDDGSTDSTPLVIQALARDPRVVTKRTEKSGIGTALNTGLDLATGDFIAFLDADDEYTPHHISSHLKMMEAHPETDILWGGLEVIADSEDDMLVPNVEAGFGFISIHECVAQGTLFVRRHVFDAVRFAEDRSYWHDYHFFQRVKDRFKARHFQEPTYRYYRNTSASVVDRMKSSWPAEAPRSTVY
jgi:glycosyltransferase involved in cell wall biosynthesis